MKWFAVFVLALLTTSAPLPSLVEVTAKPTVYVTRLPYVGRAPESLKKGVGMPYADCKQLAALDIKWAYNWSSETWNCPGVENVPMAWAGVPPTVRGNSDWLMGFNEPDRPDQANLTPEQAATKWHGVEAMYPERKLVAPAPSHLDPDWLARFRDAYIAAYGEAPRLDALAIHCYLPTADECIALVQKFEDWAAEWGISEVWVTEWSFGVAGGIRTQEQAWIQDDLFIRWMNAEPIVTRHAFFALKIKGNERWAFPPGWNTSLLTPNGNMTFWGCKYAGLC